MILLDPAAIHPDAFSSRIGSGDAHCELLAAWLGDPERRVHLMVGELTSELAAEQVELVRQAIPPPWRRPLMDVLMPVLMRRHSPDLGFPSRPETTFSPGPQVPPDDSLTALALDFAALSDRIDAVLTTEGRWPRNATSCMPPPPSVVPLVASLDDLWLARVAPPRDWDHFVERLELCEAISEGAIVFTERAKRGVSTSTYPRMAELWRATADLADAAIAYRRAAGDVGMRIHAWFATRRLKYAGTDAKLKRDDKFFVWEGESLSREAHIKVSDAQHGKAQTGRIYFACQSRGDASAFVVDHIGGHL